AGTLVGTVKIITYAVPQAALAQAEALAQRAIRVQPVVRRSAGLLMTDVPGQQDRLIAKGRRAVEARLRALGMTLAGVATVPHETDAMARALANLPGEMLLILTGSATSDPCDTAPQAVRAAGGTVLRFGMPVDPGNLLFHGHLGSRPVIGLPGCARSPALNGADWVLERLACGLTLTDDDIAAMGVGGLLKEIPVRPQPREAQQGRPTHG
ncbi:MAG: molybdopterin-binding protein, partial [Rhodobacter sp.]